MCLSAYGKPTRARAGQYIFIQLDDAPIAAATTVIVTTVTAFTTATAVTVVTAVIAVIMYALLSSPCHVRLLCIPKVHLSNEWAAEAGNLHAVHARWSSLYRTACPVSCYSPGCSTHLLLSQHPSTVHAVQRPRASALMPFSTPPAVTHFDAINPCHHHHHSILAIE